MTDPVKKDDSRNVFGRHLALLDLIAKSSQPPGFAQLQAASGLPKATLHRFLETLTGNGLLELEPRTRTYLLGMRLIKLASAAWKDHDLRRTAADELEKLRDLTGETVRLAIPDGGEMLYIDQFPSRNPVRLDYHIGSRGPAYCSGTGKAYLAFLESGERRALIKRLTLKSFTGRTLTTVAALMKDLDASQRRGFAVDDGEQTEGIRALGVPLLDERRRPIAAISVTVPSYRVARRALESMAPQVIAAAERVGLRYRGSVAPGAVA